MDHHTSQKDFILKHVKSSVSKRRIDYTGNYNSRALQRQDTLSSDSGSHRVCAKFLEQKSIGLTNKDGINIIHPLYLV